ncbi:hypothetical protein [Brevibacillus dissolubilis]|uniref:hypothetical protein n=1 Tax=Brevibacillus dissolubilis TaxID=1844116 RepID=UPI001116738A|nr:hypothetical protein [Brevibacillus dissolubilis]
MLTGTTGYYIFYFGLTLVVGLAGRRLLRINRGGIRVAFGLHLLLGASVPVMLPMIGDAGVIVLLGITALFSAGIVKRWVSRQNEREAEKREAERYEASKRKKRVRAEVMAAMAEAAVTAEVAAEPDTATKTDAVTKADPVFEPSFMDESSGVNHAEDVPMPSFERMNPEEETTDPHELNRTEPDQSPAWELIDLTSAEKARFEQENVWDQPDQNIDHPREVKLDDEPFGFEMSHEDQPRFLPQEDILLETHKEEEASEPTILYDFSMDEDFDQELVDQDLISSQTPSNSSSGLAEAGFFYPTDIETWANTTPDELPDAKLAGFTDQAFLVEEVGQQGQREQLEEQVNKPTLPQHQHSVSEQSSEELSEHQPSVRPSAKTTPAPLDLQIPDEWRLVDVEEKK